MKNVASTTLTLLLILAVAVPPGLFAQAEPRRPGSLRIYVLQGEGAVNNISSRIATSPLVEVRDANDFPVAGATVTFELPASGPGAVFEGGKLEYSNVSDGRGQASAMAMAPNQIEGKFAIKVTARLNGQTGMTAIHQTNSSKEFSAYATGLEKPSFWRRYRWLLIGAGLGTGAGMGYYFATRSSTSGAVLRPGTVVIGGPR